LTDYFEILGLPSRYDVTAEELEARYHARSKVLHPDRHAKAEPAVRVKNALATAELNQAYRTLRDPVKRGEYLLKRAGIDVADEKRTVSGAFLVEVMELRESLAEARAGRDDAQIAALAVDVRGRRGAAMKQVADGFARGALDVVASALVALRYFDRFLDEVAAHEDRVAESTP
jgi:molecular chaperone HscB